MYCSLNEVIIDMSGNGVEDCQGRPPILRIPYPEKQWGTWMHLYHRWINLWRWFKFRARGQVSSSNGAADMKFVCEQLAKHCGDEDLRHTFVDYIGGEVKQKSDAQKMEYARKLHGVFCDDYASAMGVETNEAAVWFATSMLGWMPDWFKEVVEALRKEIVDFDGGSMVLAKVQREMWQLAKEFHITASHELSVAAKQELEPINNEDTAGFTQLPWEPQGAKVYRSPDFTAFIKLLGNQKVPGLIDKYGKHLSINDVLKELETIKPRIPALYMGGFIRDLIKNKRADDIDFSFATDPAVGVIENQLLCVSSFLIPPFLRASRIRA
jgi:hypothetical protein